MIISIHLVIALTLACFIIGLIIGVLLMKPRYYGNVRGHSSSSRRYEE
jgi:hypothetical protein